jgi:hypothetical protein
VEIVFPPGCVALVGLLIKDGLHQVWPTNAGDFFQSDNERISFREHHPMLYEPFELQAITWNNDETYYHSIIIRIGILPVRVLAPWLLSYEERYLQTLGAV